MGLGYTLSEQIIMDGGRTLNTNFLDYKMPMAADMPQSEQGHVETYEPEGPLGAKEAGEGLASPTAPAISDAVWHATGYRCKDLPITPEKVAPIPRGNRNSRSGQRGAAQSLEGSGGGARSIQASFIAHSVYYQVIDACVRGKYRFAIYVDSHKNREPDEDPWHVPRVKWDCALMT